MEPRRKHQLDLCGTPNATLCEYTTEQLAELALETPYYPPLLCQLPPVDAQRLAQDRSNKIFASYHDLRAILERHEATIQKRWAKKGKTQRQAILVKAWPGSKYLLTLCSFSWGRACPQSLRVPLLALKSFVGMP